MTDTLSESVADKIVIKNLMQELRKRNHMGKILVDPKTGRLYNVSHFDELTNDEIDADIERSKKNIETLQEARAFAEQFKQPEADTAAPAPVPEQPQPAPAPVVPAPVPVTDNTVAQPQALTPPQLQ